MLVACNQRVVVLVMVVTATVYDVADQEQKTSYVGRYSNIKRGSGGEKGCDREKEDGCAVETICRVRLQCIKGTDNKRLTFNGLLHVKK